MVLWISFVRMNSLDRCVCVWVCRIVTERGDLAIGEAEAREQCDKPIVDCPCQARCPRGGFMVLIIIIIHHIHHQENVVHNDHFDLCKGPKNKIGKTLFCSFETTFIFNVAPSVDCITNTQIVFEPEDGAVVNVFKKIYGASWKKNNIISHDKFGCFDQDCFWVCFCLVPWAMHIRMRRSTLIGRNLKTKRDIGKWFANSRFQRTRQNFNDSWAELS